MSTTTNGKKTARAAIVLSKKGLGRILATTTAHTLNRSLVAAWTYPVFLRPARGSHEQARFPRGIPGRQMTHPRRNPADIYARLLLPEKAERTARVTTLLLIPSPTA